MTAALSERVPHGPEWLYEVKLDGYRAIAVKRGGQVQLFSRKENDLTRDYPAVARAVAQVRADSAVLDGEIVALDAEGRPSFQALQHRATRKHAVVFYAFDLLHRDGTDLRRLSLQERKTQLEEVLGGSDVKLSPVLEGHADDIVTAVKGLGLEGIIAKRRKSPYQSVRSGDWLKIKFLARQEFVVGGYKPGYQTFESLIVGYYRDGQLWFAGKVRNGFSPWLRSELWRRIAPLQSPEYPFADRPSRSRSHWGEGLTVEDMTKLRWLRPVLVAEVAFVEWTADGKLRHPTFVGLRPDKDAGEVVREQATRTAG